MATKKSKLKKAPAKTTVTPKTATTADPATQPADPSALSIGDLKNLSTILDVASSRGAFRANEMAGVGLMYNKLQAFLAKVASPAEAPTKVLFVPDVTDAPAEFPTAVLSVLAAVPDVF